MGAGLATTEDKKRDSTPESSPAATPQWTPSTFAPSGRGAWGDSSNDSSKGGSAAGAPAGMPLFLQPQVQMKCAQCAKEEEEQGSPQPPIQKKCAHCEAEQQHRREQGIAPVQAKCAACEAEGLQEKSANGAAADGVANANRPLPHVDRIQASFGRHDVRGARAAVGGDAGKASGRMGALAYTSGNRVAFRGEPDVNLAAHEAAHVVQQRNGARLPGGVGRPGDGYERQADAAAKAVERGESAEPILDRGVSSDSGGGSAPVVQHRLEVNAKREFEPPGMPSAAGAGGLPAEGGKTAAGGKTVDRTAKAGDNSDKSDKNEKTQKEDKDGKDGPKEAPKAGGGSPNGSSQPGAAPLAAKPEAPANGAQPGSQASPAPQNGGAPVPAGGAAPGEAPATGAAGGSPASASAGGGNAPAGAGCTAACYHGPKDDPPESQKSDEKPADPPPGKAEEQTSDAGEQDLPEPDDCSTQQAQAGAPGAGPGGAPATAPAVAQPVGTGGAPAGPAAAPGSAAGTPAAQKPASDSPAASGAGGAAPAGGGAKVGGSPMDGSIAQGEGQRSAAVASYEASSRALETTAANTNDLRSGVSFAASGGAGDQAQQAAAEERANRFFSQAAEGLDEAIAFAVSSAPDQLGAQADAAKAQMVASASARKDAISARIQTGRDEARADAAMAKRAVNQQADSFIAEAQSSAATAVATLNAAHGEAMGQVDALESATLEQVNGIYSNGRAKLEALGVTVGNECTATGEQFASTYGTFVDCTEDGFWDGNLSERRAKAQAEASRKTAKGYHDRMVDAAKKRAKEVAKDGRKKNRCQVITTASAVRDKLDPTLQQLTSTIESARDQAIAQTGGTRAALLASIDSGLQATLRQLDQQEHDQRQAIDDTCYLQQVLQEQMAHSAAASIQGLVTGAASSLHETLFQFRRLFESHAAPDPQALDQTLNGVSAKIEAALGQMQSGLDSGMATATGQLASVAAQGLSALASVVASNDEAAAGLTGGFGSQMGEISGQDNFASQRAGFAQMVEQATTGGTGAFQQLAGAMRDGCAKTTEDSQKSLAQAGVDLEANLRQQKQGLECQITKEATEAASHEPPAWKKLVAYLLIILVVLIVIAVTVLTAGAGLGLLAVIALGAVVGAVTAGLITMAQNLLSNQDVTKGLVKAMIVGAITGAAGGALGMGIGSALGKVAGAIGGKVVAELGATLITAAVMDVGSQFYEGGFSFKHFSLGHLGFSLAVAVVTFGMGKYAESRNLGSLARGALRIGGRTPAGPAPVEPLPAEQAPIEPAPTESAPPTETSAGEPPTTKPAAAEPASAEPPAAGPKPDEPVPAEAKALPEAPPAEPAEAGAPPKSGAHEDTAPAAEGEAPTTPEEKATLDRTAGKHSADMSPEEVQTEREVASRTEGEPIDDPPFTTEKKLPNGHEVKETPAGEEGPCERCSDGCAVFDENGKPIPRPAPNSVEGTPAAKPSETPAAPEVPSAATPETAPTPEGTPAEAPRETAPSPEAAGEKPVTGPEEKPATAPAEEKPPAEKLGKDGLTDDQRAEFRNKIDNPPEGQTADDMRFERYKQRLRNQGRADELEEPNLREKWDASKERLEANRERGAEQEDNGREALKKAIGRPDLRNNNAGEVEQATFKDPETGKDVTTRPDSIATNEKGEVDVVHDHKDLSGKEKVVYDTEQMRAERKMITASDGKHYVTVSSNEPNLTGSPPVPRPSAPLAEKSTIIYSDQGGQPTHQWVVKDSLPGGGYWKKL